MDDQALIMEKLEQVVKNVDRLGIKIDTIEEALKLIAVQNERLNTMSVQVSNLWSKHDEKMKIINRIATFQAGCPRESVKIDLARQWSIILLLSVTVSGSLLKAFGIL